MDSRTYIRKVIAAFLLLLFAFSATPKKWLHDAFADHHDNTVALGKVNTVQESNTGISCKCENLFAQPVFTMAEQDFSFAPLPVIGIKQETDLSPYSPATLFFIELRGPPALG